MKKGDGIKGGVSDSWLYVRKRGRGGGGHSDATGGWGSKNQENVRM